ncbi:hypothetical protein D0T49_09715 [Paludibacter sp. 221]|uniref:hypothetical protein n=1 Tax=Paludibacter sp. 221 TaxID=2302939 RepID=UPI0013D1B907|nr:hypothetical protein [Paludibacter sp. 221]NDV47321.1 hypothetical protein [Paludibacter sp. 221]
MKLIKNLILFGIIALLLPSCATIVGGSTYNAHVIVNGSPDAEITFNNRYKGKGTGTFPVRRKDANKVVIKVQEEGCEEQTFMYRSRAFRGWAFVGSVLGWTGIIQGIPLPWGIVVDLATGAVWKPDIMEPGVSKMDYNNFQYFLNYTGCPKETPYFKEQVNEESIPNEQEAPKPLNAPAKTLIDVLYLTNGNVMKGIIIEQVPNQMVKIQTFDNQTFIFSTNDIEKIEREMTE